MSQQDHPLELLIICAVIVVFSIFGVIGGISSRLSGSLDGLLLIGICLITLLVFSILLFVLAKDSGWLGGGGAKKDDQTPAAAKK